MMMNPTTMVRIAGGVVVALIILIPLWALYSDGGMIDRTRKVNACIVELGPQPYVKDFCWAIVSGEDR